MINLSFPLALSQYEGGKGGGEKGEGGGAVSLCFSYKRHAYDTWPIQCLQILIHSQQGYQIYMNIPKGFSTLCSATVATVTCNATNASHLC